MHGLVIKNTGSWYTVKTDDGRQIESKVKGNFRLKGIRSTNPVAVGDYVDITVNPEGTALITAIDDRKNYIVRKSQNLSKQSHILAANLDQAMCTVEGRAFCQSLLSYLQSEAFQPATALSATALRHILQGARKGPQLKKLDNISQY